ncbi:Multidrug/Oligosaccharidyl-lipid/Polysaccharide (MOP) Flippase Superfamily [Achlya hypogyna]|uniref:Multidrug/Oligosaccharidyl-lipid/Polysaccharide (MOP) Flippase Superfamily n=1 Tax=Achlya hypogyna TaxID=1202772 RepID=A0A1V9ZRB4_ACHHY|nr:Multidrug/Oligosaccharidyl-lipid/Polysaccharide (MOP) Flippase Superfamily [Achlya hypogyna]
MTYHSVVDDPQCLQTSSASWKAELKHLLSLAGPMIFALFMESLHNTISVVLVGQIDSPLVTEYVDAATMASMFMSITSFSVGIGLSSALDTLCTQAHGAGNTKQFGVYFQSSHLGMALILVPVVVLNWFSGDILAAWGQDEEISALAGTFTRYVTIGLPFYYVYQLIRRFLQAYDIVFPMTVVAVLSNGVHIGLGYYLCHHTSLGFNGAAIARCVSYVVLPLFMAPYFVLKPIHREWGLHWNSAVAVANLREFFRFGIPGLLMVMMEYTAFEILTLMAGWLPNHKVMIGVNSVIINLITMFYMVYLGISFSGTIRIGNLLGANKPEEARRVALMALCLSASCSLITAGTMLFARHQLPKVFINDPEVVEAASEAILCMLVLHIIDTLNAVNQGIFRAIAKPVIATVVNAATYYPIGISMAAACAFGLGWDVNGLFIGFTTGALTACALYAWQLRKIDWSKAATEAVTRSAPSITTLSV